MMEVVYNYDEFKSGVDVSKPVHHDAWRDSKDEHGIFHELTFRIYGISKSGGHVLVYEAKATVSTLNVSDEFRKSNNAYDNLRLWVKDIFDCLAKEKAEPLGSTPGDGSLEGIRKRLLWGM
jgi:hypothetical protein